MIQNRTLEGRAALAYVTVLEKLGFILNILYKRLIICGRSGVDCNEKWDDIKEHI
ncbi:MAG: hypothetical protein K2L07_15240 [Lachnospiraceae bacterium]|nr:hypothetical protein [Lachnospiraceae bacterium]